MKKTIIAIVVLVLILTAGILETIYIEKTFKELSERVTEARNLIIKEDAEGALKIIDDTTNWWEERKDKLELITFSPDLRALSAALGETKGSLMCGDTQNALSKVESILIMSDNVREIINFNIRDII
ncbi:MAG: DUF4363 family protein [Clostridiales bacterium]|nr:DUF4363 family protein [Clostridiales bacterium]